MGERVELFVHDADSEMSYYFARVLSGGRTTDHEVGLANDPTDQVTTDVAMHERVRSAENPAAVASTAYQSGKIDVDCVGVVGTVLMTVVEIAVDAGTILDLF